MQARTTSQQDPPIRLFRSDFLEFFSHISPVAVAILWTPIVLFFLRRSVIDVQKGTPWWVLPIGLFTGWFVWTFVEYTMHRFIFHYHPRTERLKRMFFMVHGVHHAQPMCRTRLVMPPALSVPLALAFYGLFHYVMNVVMGLQLWFNPVFAGFLGGYLIYDLMHYNLHHSRVKNGAFFTLRKHHLRHHGRRDYLRFGVTMPLWDHVFGTMPGSDCADETRQRIAEYQASKGVPAIEK
jgi:sterol desaturase/sphingolipid hydroxylase (fatty acid hydroxylase superfamily)